MRKPRTYWERQEYRKIYRSKFLDKSLKLEFVDWLQMLKSFKTI